MRIGFNAGGTQLKQEVGANGFRDQEAAQGHEQAQAQEAPEESPFQQVSALSQGGAPKTPLVTRPICRQAQPANGEPLAACRVLCGTMGASCGKANRIPPWVVLATGMASAGSDYHH